MRWPTGSLSEPSQHCVKSPINVSQRACLLPRPLPASRFTPMQSHPRSRRRMIDGDEDVDFVRCRICGNHRRVISGRHLSKHNTDRETYMEEYHITSDELIAKDFRVLQSSRRGYSPHSKSEWIAATKTFHEKHGKVFAKYLQRRSPHLYRQGAGFLGI